MTTRQAWRAMLVANQVLFAARRRYNDAPTFNNYMEWTNRAHEAHTARTTFERALRGVQGSISWVTVGT